jgi:hypothetical protein
VNLCTYFVGGPLRKRVNYRTSATIWLRQFRRILEEHRIPTVRIGRRSFILWTEFEFWDSYITNSDAIYGRLMNFS